jgi:hypothetical protein
MPNRESDASPAAAHFAELESSLIRQFLEARGHTRDSVAALPQAERDALLAQASVYASTKLSEVESRSHLLDDLRHGHPAR